MTSDRKQLARHALGAALQLRTGNGKNLVDPICVYDFAESLRIEVRFVDISSLEGMYSAWPRPAIILGSERPAGRRAYSCGHELGHHHFGHGARVDELRPSDADAPPFEPEEFLAQSFAGFLLMPKLAICNAFTIRGWKPNAPTPEQIYRISNVFGVTYSGLIYHMARALRLLAHARAEQLLSAKLPTIRAQFITDPKRQLVMLDDFWKGRPIDLEVGDLVHAPSGIVCEGGCLLHIEHTASRELFEASQPGHGRFTNPRTGWASFARVSRRFYVGRSIYRHLEEVADEYSPTN
jgi:Zn-dependent peptidase ImmA (M78 family)